MLRLLSFRTHPLTKATINHLVSCAKLFKVKSKGYASGDDPFANFHEAQPVVKGILSPFVYAATLCSKQDDAVWATIKEQRPEQIRDLRERIRDGITYRAIMLTLLDEMEGDVDVLRGAGGTEDGEAGDSRGEAGQDGSTDGKAVSGVDGEGSGSSSVVDWGKERRDLPDE